MFRSSKVSDTITPDSVDSAYILLLPSWSHWRALAWASQLSPWETDRVVAPASLMMPDLGNSVQATF